MAAGEFAELVGRLVESMGQQMDSIRHGSEGLLVKTGDGFLFAFLEDPDRVSLDTVTKLLAEVGDAPMRLVVLTPGRLPLALQAELFRRGASVVDGGRFLELARSLGLERYLGEEPRGDVAPVSKRLLPSAHQLDAIMTRARHWQEWGVPALALRFYRQASSFKPEFLPAKDGIGRALLALGLAADADRVFDEVLAAHPEDVDARLGKAAVLGATGHVAREVAIYRELLDSAPARLDVRTHLVAALIAEKDWAAAREEIERMLEHAPEDPHLRFLHYAALEHTGASDEARRERVRARDLGLSPERERSLSEHLGVAPPPAAAPVAVPTPAAPAVRSADPGPPATSTPDVPEVPGSSSAPKARRRRAPSRKPKKRTAG